MDALNVIVRWFHITSAVALIGGVLFARLVALPAAQFLPASDREKLGEAMAARFRPWVLSAAGALLLTGIYNMLRNLGRGPLYSGLLGIKMLLALHVFAVGSLIVRPRNERRARMMTGVIISGLIIVVISACLRQLHLS